MLILGIDSSGHTASCALLEDGVVLAEYSTNIGLTHSQTLLPMVAEIFSRTGREVRDLDAIAVSAGPGSFTGLRIGASTAKGLALGYKIPLIEVSTLQALARNVSVQIPGDVLYIHPIMDARRNQVYTAAFANEELVGEEEAISIDHLVQHINALGGRHMFLGDAVPVYRDYLIGNLTVPYCFAGPQNTLQRASSVAIIGAEKYQRGQSVSGPDFKLSYIRKPQAEREKEEAGLREYDITHDDPEKLKKAKAADVLEARNYKIGTDAGYEDESLPENL
ncbi:tRNA (adenosine(37)-N6)-threonylcarbamoyltransferase complex dimerization subunit type 1 TsaB [Oribacterium sp. WCC10]|uniref:tRNA (adenosine(37)-N6)-threonylcarbamoyltransferase complex dimerization subunit type 1 TsaB n=1 Tax=Oribacterium sp. WCC10 TaxID=1855343 RepID=UPI0008F28698|nr:tRNA (adenosine(37)-N6)-threonylcarbamoyltransferase complex dimerization subunit type 1 TsaB [Oribacterium sp. WCC10]SFG50559.1 tRNA threonylcarbamoyladenosine biosynthesis protein TsaB [Oribacterium sp. WCC10]